MKEVFVDQDHARVGFFQSILDEAGIPCYIRDEYGNTSLAGRKSTFFAPALCVVNDEDYDRAKAILDDMQSAPATAEKDWVCPECSEEVPATFGSCWKCGAIRPGTAPSE